MDLRFRNDLLCLGRVPSGSSFSLTVSMPLKLFPFPPGEEEDMAVAACGER